MNLLEPSFGIELANRVEQFLEFVQPALTTALLVLESQCHGSTSLIFIDFWRCLVLFEQNFKVLDLDVTCV